MQERRLLAAALAWTLPATAHTVASPTPAPAPADTEKLWKIETSGCSG